LQFATASWASARCKQWRKANRELDNRMKPRHKIQRPISVLGSKLPVLKGAS
jgi:hypothetical protein